MGRSHGQILWERLDKFPPLFLRLLARHPRGKPLTTLEISKRSGLSALEVHAMSWHTDWRGIDIPTARAYMAGVGIDLTCRKDVRRIRMYIRSAPKDPRMRFPYLRKSPEWESFYLPLLVTLLKHLKR